MSKIDTSGSAAPASLVPADYPACMCWFDCNEGAGAVLSDRMGNLADIPLVLDGAGGGQWSATRAFQSSDAVADTIYATRELTANDLLYLTIGATDKFIFELEYNLLTDPSHHSPIFNFGTGDDGNKGWWWAFEGSQKPYLRLYDDSASVFSNTTSALAAIALATKHRTVFVLDNEAGSITWYQNGDAGIIVPEGGSFGYNAITPNITANNRISIGGHFKSTRRADINIHNVRVWKIQNTQINTIIDDFVQQTYLTGSDEFPSVMNGVT